MHPNQSMRFNAASIVGVVAVSASVKKRCWLNWSLIMSHAPLALKPSASALMALIAFSSLDHCRLPELVVGYLGNVCLVLVVRNVHWIYNHT